MKYLKGMLWALVAVLIGGMAATVESSEQKWVLLLEVVVQTANGPVVHLDSTEIKSKELCNQTAELVKNYAVNQMKMQNLDYSVNVQCVFKANRSL